MRACVRACELASVRACTCVVLFVDFCVSVVWCVLLLLFFCFVFSLLFVIVCSFSISVHVFPLLLYLSFRFHNDMRLTLT